MRNLRWPLMTKARHDREMALMEDAIRREYARATIDGMTKVRAWAVDANFNVFNHPVPRAAAGAAFQEAQKIFRPDPLTVKEVLNGAE